jgi:hypothetical protein
MLKDKIFLKKTSRLTCQTRDLYYETEITQ